MQVFKVFSTVSDTELGSIVVDKDGIPLQVFPIGEKTDMRLGPFMAFAKVDSAFQFRSLLESWGMSCEIWECEATEFQAWDIKYFLNPKTNTTQLTHGYGEVEAFWSESMQHQGRPPATPIRNLRRLFLSEKPLYESIRPLAEIK